MHTNNYQISNICSIIINSIKNKQELHSRLIKIRKILLKSIEKIKKMK